MPETAYRMTTAAKILRRLCNEKKNSDLRADNPDFLHALNVEFNAREARIAELEKERDAARSMEQQLIQEKEAHKLTNRALIKYRAEAGTKGLLIQTLEKRLANTRKLAREAVEVLRTIRTFGTDYMSCHFAAAAFLAKPEVKALGGGK